MCIKPAESPTETLATQAMYHSFIPFSVLWKHSLLLQDMFFHATQRRHKIRGDTFVRNNQGLTPLTLAAKLGRKEMFHEILEYQSMVRNDFHVTITRFL